MRSSMWKGFGNCEFDGQNKLCFEFQVLDLKLSKSIQGNSETGPTDHVKRLFSVSYWPAPWSVLS